MKVATVRAQVGLLFHNDFEEFVTLTPQPHQVAALTATLDDVVAWSRALAPLRA
ncbi:hypothetical protein [Phytohabitans kaempferiae]|uniref:Uncharacterized protein n=1 Tax=Phytohabitans kaempferiae TaxID=1620943 RepID=A0ABV6MA52_9ACTN